MSLLLLLRKQITGGGGLADITRRGSPAVGGTGAATTSHVVPVPSGTLQDDVIVVGIAFNGSPGTITAPGGWTELSVTASPPSNPRLALYRRVASSSEPADYTWTTTGTIYSGYVAASYVNVDTTTPEDMTPGVTLGDVAGTSPSLIANTTVTDKAMVLALIASNSSSQRITENSALSEVGEAFGSSIKNVELDEGIQAVAGSTGTIDYTLDASLNWAGIVWALRPASTGGGATTVSDDFTSDSILLRTETPSVTADSIIQKTGTATFTSDAILLKTIASSFTADAIVNSTVSATFTGDSVLFKTATFTFAADSIILKSVSATWTADAVLSSLVAGTFSADAVIFKTSSGTYTADAWLNVAPIWTTPINGDPIEATDTFSFLSPLDDSDLHFQMEFDKVNTFDSGFYELFDSSVDQTGWEYWNDSAWVPLPSTGLPVEDNGNEVRLTVTFTSGGRWYRRVRAGAE